MEVVVKLKTAILIAFMTWSISSFAQVETMMYVMKNGKVVFQSPISGVNNVTFDEATPDSTLIVRKNDGSPADKILLNNIQQLSLSDTNLSVNTSSGSEIYVYEDIMKLLFGDLNTSGIKNTLAWNNFDVLVSVTPAGDVLVESTVTIKSLTLFGIDGKMISMHQCKGAETQCIIISLQNRAAGVYLLRVETEQGTAVKKVLNH